jgi:hypothetical protein
MFDFATTLVTRAARLLQAAQNQPALWTISAHGRVVGSLVCDAGGWRISWFSDADPRLVSYAGSLDGDVEALAASLGARLGAPVSLESLPV